MVEHREIERLFDVMRKESAIMENLGKPNLKFIDIMTDFFVTYIDMVHHGKEENILFEALKKKNMRLEHKKLMNELLDEHKRGRRVVEGIISAAESYTPGDKGIVADLKSYFDEFLDIYVNHIKKEDENFFIPVMAYFNKEEKDAMVQKFWEFELGATRDKYKEILTILEQER